MAKSSLLIEANSKLLFIGDSLTDCGRARPSGEGLFGAHGTGFVNTVFGLLGSVYSDHRIRVVNQGCSGDTVRELNARWNSDVVAHKPDSHLSFHLEIAKVLFINKKRNIVT